MQPLGEDARHVQGHGRVRGDELRRVIRPVGANRPDRTDAGAVGQVEQCRHFAEHRTGIGDPRHLCFPLQNDDFAGDQDIEVAAGITFLDQAIVGGETRFGQAGAGSRISCIGASPGGLEQLAQKMMRCKAARGACGGRHPDDRSWRKADSSRAVPRSTMP